MQRNVSDLYSMKVHSENVRPGSNTYPLHLHLGEAERADTDRFSNWRERATKDKVPLIMVMAPVN